MSNVDVATRETARQNLFATIAARPWKAAALAGLGGSLTVAALAMANASGNLPLLIAPFGASCVLVFGVPTSPFSRPRNVIGGHLIAALTGLCAVSVLGHGPLAIAVGVGLAIAAMMLTDTVHPPAGANPIVVALTHAGWPFLGAPVLAGSVAIVVAGALYHQATRAIR